MRRRYDRKREQAPDPNWQQPTDTSRCAKTQDGKHRWITAYRLPDSDQVGQLPYPTCMECLEIDDRELQAVPQAEG